MHDLHKVVMCWRVLKVALISDAFIINSENCVRINKLDLYYASVENVAIISKS